MKNVPTPHGGRTAPGGAVRPRRENNNIINNTKALSCLPAVQLRSPGRVSAAPGRWKTCGKNALPHGGPSPLDLLTNIYVLYETYSGASLRPSWVPERISLPPGTITIIEN